MVEDPQQKFISAPEDRTMGDTATHLETATTATTTFPPFHPDSTDAPSLLQQPPPQPAQRSQPTTQQPSSSSFLEDQCWFAYLDSLRRLTGNTSKSSRNGLMYCLHAIGRERRESLRDVASMAMALYGVLASYPVGSFVASSTSLMGGGDPAHVGGSCGSGSSSMSQETDDGRVCVDVDGGVCGSTEVTHSSLVRMGTMALDAMNPSTSNSVIGGGMVAASDGIDANVSAPNGRVSKRKLDDVLDLLADISDKAAMASRQMSSYDMHSNNPQNYAYGGQPIVHQHKQRVNELMYASAAVEEHLRHQSSSMVEYRSCSSSGGGGGGIIKPPMVSIPQMTVSSATSLPRLVAQQSAENMASQATSMRRAREGIVRSVSTCNSEELTYAADAIRYMLPKLDRPALQVLFDIMTKTDDDGDRESMLRKFAELMQQYKDPSIRSYPVLFTMVRFLIGHVHEKMAKMGWAYGDAFEYAGVPRHHFTYDAAPRIQHGKAVKFFVDRFGEGLLIAPISWSRILQSTKDQRYEILQTLEKLDMERFGHSLVFFLGDQTAHDIRNRLISQEG